VRDSPGETIMAEYQTLDLQEDANLYLFPDPQALQDVIDAHNAYDDPSEPLVLSGMDYANYLQLVA